MYGGREAPLDAQGKRKVTHGIKFHVLKCTYSCNQGQLPVGSPCSFVRVTARLANGQTISYCCVDIADGRASSSMGRLVAELQPRAVPATSCPPEPELLGTKEANVYGGVANLTGLRLQALKASALPRALAVRESGTASVSCVPGAVLEGATTVLQPPQQLTPLRATPTPPGRGLPPDLQATGHGIPGCGRSGSGLSSDPLQARFPSHARVGTEASRVTGRPDGCRRDMVTHLNHGNATYPKLATLRRACRRSPRSRWPCPCPPATWARCRPTTTDTAARPAAASHTACGRWASVWAMAVRGIRRTRWWLRPLLAVLAASG